MYMKKLLLVFAVVLAAVLPAKAQKVGFINTDSVLLAIPEYQTAIEQLDAQADKYKSQLDQELQVIDRLYTSYQSQKSYLSSSQRTSIENDIVNKEQQLKARQEQYFGQDGVMAKQSESLLSPIRNKVTNAIASYATANGYSMIIDTAVNTGIVFKRDSDDITSAIIKYFNK